MMVPVFSTQAGLVTTIIPVFNRPNLVARCVRSVVAQTYKPIEIIVVDDGSTDDTPRVVNVLAAEFPGVVRVIHQRNLGPGHAREAGRMAARGAFVQYLDSDDVLLPRKFELQVSALAADRTAGIAYCRTVFGREVDQTEDLLPWKRTAERIETLLPSMLADRWWGTSTPLYRRECIDANGPWLDLRVNEDWEYDCRLGSTGVRLTYVPEVLSREYDHVGARLSRDSSFDPGKLRDRTWATHYVFEHARRVGVDESATEMRHFAKAAFLLARQCGAAGLGLESKGLYDLAGKAAPLFLARCWKYRLYGVLAQCIGWSTAGYLVGRC